MAIYQAMKEFGFYLRQKLHRDGNQNTGICHNSVSTFLWIFAVLPPLLTIIFSYSLQRWDWGLMDDASILGLGVGVIDRSWIWFKATCAFGQFRPLNALHSGVFYTIFEAHPKWFYIFKEFEICVVLLLWGIAAYRITRNTLSLVLVPAITLSFHYFYDGFFYLTSHEIIGLLFTGIAFHFFLSNLEYVLGVDFDSDRVRGKSLGLKTWLPGLFFLLCAFGSKETFVSGGIAFGLSYLYLAWKNRRRNCFVPVLLLGIFLIVITVVYSFLLLFVVKSSYTSGYTLDIPKFVSNFKVWFKKDFINHLPWIVGTIFIFSLHDGLKHFKESIAGFTLKLKWGALLGALFYFGFLVILLPWSTIGYYATPFGLFFAFLVVLLISNYLSKANIRLQVLALICALVLNQLVCQYALTRESIYQYDTYNLMEWFKTNPLFHRNNGDYNVYSNAMEPSGSIPSLINRKWHLQLKGFHWSTDPNQLIKDNKCDFYLYSPRFHSIDMNKLRDWDTVFLSKNWIMYRRSDK